MPSTNSSKIKQLILEGTPEERMAVFSFNENTPNEKILLKFKLFARSNLFRYFKSKSAPFHDEMVLNMIKSYRGENYVNIAFRGSSKTTLAKLFLVFVLLNDENNFRKYIKILSRDIKNPKQIVTDVFNMCLELRPIYGNVFEKEGEKKREERMDSFTMKSGVKVTAGTVGQSQRGNIQDAFRPDWLILDDIEDRESVSSLTITEGIISRIDEAITGLAKGGSWTMLGNYISEYGSVQWFLDKTSRNAQITPIAVDGVPTWDIYSPEEIEQLKKDSEDFYGEYMCDPSRSEGKFFDIERIEADMKRCKPPMYTVGGAKYWGAYQSHHRYGIGADTSEGVGQDSSALANFDFVTGELVTSYHSNVISPELFAYEIARVGHEYGDCIVAPEMNSMSGGIVVTTLKAIYNNIFRHTDRTKVRETESPKLGWHTNSRSKPQMFMEFRRDYNDGIVHIYDMDVLKEMKSYSNLDLADESKITRHFDLLMAVVIAWQMRNEIAEKNVATVSYSQ